MVAKILCGNHKFQRYIGDSLLLGCHGQYAGDQKAYIGPRHNAAVAALNLPENAVSLLYAKPVCSRL